VAPVANDHMIVTEYLRLSSLDTRQRQVYSYWRVVRWAEKQEQRSCWNVDRSWVADHHKNRSNYTGLMFILFRQTAISKWRTHILRCCKTK